MSQERVGEKDADLPHATRTTSGIYRTSTEIVAAWDGDDDPQNPVNWSKVRKWRVTGFACFMCFCAGLNALSISSAAGEINNRFGISDATFPNSYWTVTAWNFGASVFPVIIIPLLEDFSVRVGYLTAFGAFIAFVIPQAVARNYATLIVTRFFAGGCASIVQNGVENIIGDIWVGDETSLPVTMFVYAYLMGFTMGPVIGAAIASHLYWRWILYIELIIYGAVLPVAFLMIKETRGKIILKRQAKDESRKTGKPIKVVGAEHTSLSRLLYDSTIRPAYLLSTEPVIFFFTLWGSLAISTIFIGTQSILQIYGKLYDFSEVQAGYVQASMAIGMTISIPICLWQNRIYARSRHKNKDCPGDPIPESRLSLSIPCSFIGLAGGLFIYAWTSYSSVHWIGPTIGLGLMGIGIMVVGVCAVAYITDAYGIWAGSAVAAFACVENLFSGFLPLCAQSMYTTLGFQWASSLLGFIALALSFTPLVLYLKGPTIRRKSKWMASI